MPLLRQSTLVAVLLAAASAAAAHPAGGPGFIAGAQHPILGWDHLTAMVAVGLWGAFLGAPALWVLPLVFPTAMAAGQVLAFAGIDLPAVQAGIAAAALAIGLMVALAHRPPVAVSASVVAAFALLHGHGHGAELALFEGSPGYATGFLLGTLFLHLTGIAIGTLAQWPGGTPLVRAFGAAIAFAGVGLVSL